MKQLAFRGNDKPVSSFRLRKRKSSKKNIQRVVRDMAESKRVLYNDLNSSIQDIGRAPLEYNLTSITEGDGKTQRDGHQVLMTGIKLCGQITFPDSTNHVRMVVYVRKGPYTLNPMIGKGITPIKYFEPAGYEILKDIHLSGGANGPVARTVNLSVSFKKRRDGGLPIRYNGAASTTLTNNQVGVYLVADSAAVSDPVFKGYVIAYYKDF